MKFLVCFFICIGLANLSITAQTSLGLGYFSLRNSSDIQAFSHLKRQGISANLQYTQSYSKQTKFIELSTQFSLEANARYTGFRLLTGNLYHLQQHRIGYSWNWELMQIAEKDLYNSNHGVSANLQYEWKPVVNKLEWTVGFVFPVIHYRSDQQFSHASISNWFKDFQWMTWNKVQQGTGYFEVSKKIKEKNKVGIGIQYRYFQQRFTHTQQQLQVTGMYTF